MAGDRSAAMNPQAFRSAVASAAEREEVRAAVRAVYAAAQVEIDLRRPRCELSGRCCRFDEYGHRLYLTTMEAAAFRADLTGAEAPAGAVLTGGCPFQSGRLCGVHAIRPLGCRLFFCDAGSTAWQQDLYERLHRELRAWHDRLDVPYFYVEWRAALAAIGLAVGARESL